MPDRIRTCDLVSRSFQASTDKMLYFQGLYGFQRKCPSFLNFLKSIENTGKTGFFGFTEDSSQTVVRRELWFGLGNPLLLQFRAEEDAERQAEIRVLEAAAEQLRDMGEAV